MHDRANFLNIIDACKQFVLFGILLQLTGALVCKLGLHDCPVRDCSWHPLYPNIVCSSWDGCILNYGFPDCVEKPAHLRQSLERRGHRRSNAIKLE